MKFMIYLGKFNALILILMLVTSSILELRQVHKLIDLKYTESSREFEDSRVKEKDINFLSDLNPGFFVQLTFLPVGSFVAFNNSISSVTEMTKILGPHRISLPPPSILS